MKENIIKIVKRTILITFVSLVLLLVAPVITFWWGYFCGWLTKITIGAPLVAALNWLFHTQWFTVDMLPPLGGVLAWVGSYFRPTPKVNTNPRRYF
jgi:hypothetical protein